MVRSPSGATPSGDIGPADLGALLRAPNPGPSDVRVFPPEFRFDPESGAAISDRGNSSGLADWLPPLRALPAQEAARWARAVRGLHHTERPLRVFDPLINPTADAPHHLSLPPRG